MNILFVCTGNTCRSPMAEKMLQKIAKDKQLDLQVKSAGVAAIEGYSASNHAKQVLKDYGAETVHQTTKVNKNLIDWADVVLTMTMGHKELLLSQFPEARRNVYTLKEYSLENSSDFQISEKIEKLYEAVEEKKSAFLKEHQFEINQLQEQYTFYQEKIKEIEKELEAYQRKLNDLIREELQEIKRLEREMPSLDVADPFGGDLETYRKTAKEIEGYLHKLVEKTK